MFNIKKQKAFSLMELIAVMAIMAIMAGTLAPSIFNQIKRAKADAEIQNLKTIMQSLSLYIQDKKVIPTSSTISWTQAIATVSNISIQKIEFNDNDFRRRLIFDPQFLTNVDSSFSGVTQNQGLAVEPVSPRVMIISNLTANVASVANNSSVFNDIWQQNTSALIKESADIKIERINLKSIFHRIVLSNANSTQASYQLESGSVISVPAASGGDGIIIRWVIDQSKISLYSAPVSGTSVLQQTSILQSDWTSRYQTNGTIWFWGQP